MAAHPEHRRYRHPWLTRHTTAMDGGSAENTGAFFGPFILNIAATAILGSRGIPFILNIAATAILGSRGIPFILNIKRPA